jgi:hypothetical protein
VFAGGLGGNNIAVTHFACLMAGKLDRPSREILERVATVMPILAEAFGHNDGAQGKDGSGTDDEEGCKSEQMSCVLEDSH